MKRSVLNLEWKSCGEMVRWGFGEFVVSMGQIFVAVLAGVCSKERGQLWLWTDWKIWVPRWQMGGSVLERKRKSLNEKVGSWTADGDKRAKRIRPNCVIGEWYCFEFNLLRYFNPVELFENRRDVVVVLGFCNSTSERILISWNRFIWVMSKFRKWELRLA